MKASRPLSVKCSRLYGVYGFVERGSAVCCYGSNYYSEQLHRNPAAAASDQVRRLLLSQTPGSVTESDVARAMFISKRTLARRLEGEGNSYRNIREKLLAELAGRHLRDSGLSVEALAALLGYSDTAAFRKAFRRWYGQTPSDYRQGTH